MNIRARSTFRAGSFARLEALLVPRIISAVTVGTQAVFDESQALVPVDTGELKASGSQAVEWTGTKVVGSITYSAGHAAFNEFGTGRRGAASGNGGPGIEYDPNWPGMMGSPYMRPALDIARPAIKAAFVEAGFALA